MPSLPAPPAPVRLLAGLGNPGRKYQNTRHNIGARFVRMVAEDASLRLREQARFFGQVARMSDTGALLFIPSVWMNESGRALSALCRRHGFEPPDILVVHDELDFAPGVARFKSDGGHGGHNGLRDIISALGGRRDFYRLRFGIGHPGTPEAVTPYVLARAPAEERRLCEAAARRALEALPAALRGDWDAAMNQLHSV